MLANKVRCSLKKGMLIKGMKYNSFIFFKNLFVGGRGVVCRRRKAQEDTFACWGFVQKNAMKAHLSGKNKKIILHETNSKTNNDIVCKLTYYFDSDFNY